MKLSILLLSAAVALVAAKTRWHQLEGYTFENYKVEFNKVYESQDEHDRRQAIFEKKLEGIKKHNSDTSKTWKEGVNHMTDWTMEEFKALQGYDKDYAYSRYSVASAQPNVDMAALPDAVDWREKGVVTPVKDQGRCGSCWTFASTEALESQVAIKTGIVEILSEQNILDCTPNPEECGGKGGCQGGTAELAYAALQKNGGMQTEWTYPYTSWGGVNSKCKFQQSRSVVNVTGFTQIPSNQYEPLMEAVANVGPISISVDAGSWFAYEEGVYNGCNQTNPDIDHAVQLVGYGSDNGSDYWLVRNSWTPHWGEKGYIRIARTSNEQGRCGTDITPADGTGCKGGPSSVQVCGTCGILFDSCYPLIE
eukprot:TRINITY_DN12195_c0_g1_i2.p1 TRINITY_DN12195_c0_g1~~TRINITY_DN12195_c0_g1_i2.p1  ORF type:complete len:365 (+),score=93.22 TRINITY_DN12195_c0_g1_i2:13-1107(+)